MQRIWAIFVGFMLLYGGVVSAQTLPTSTPVATDVPPTQQAPTPPSVNLAIHVVQRGETLFRIAQNYNSSVDYLAEVNGITNVGSILVGQRLLVPTDAVSLPPAITHIVQPGETLGGIANRHGVDVAALMQLNKLANADQLYVGQELAIAVSEAELESTPELELTPAVSAAPAATAEAAETAGEGIPTIGNIYTIQAGETLYQIATRFGLTVNDLVTANSLADPTLVYAGQTLIIPGAPGEETALELPAPVTDLQVTPLLFVEGETGSVRLTTSEAATITGTFLDQVVHVVASEDGLQHTLIVGIPIFTEPDVYPMSLTVEASGKRVSLVFNVRVLGGGYASQYLTVSAELAPLLQASGQEYELDLLTRTTNEFHPEQYYSGSFGLPAAAPMNSTFGTRRSYNGGALTSYHTGADFASPSGSPVLAAAMGKVVLADLLNIRGNTIVIDHGRGVYSVYCHLSEVNVQLGQVVDTGQIIGKAGATGRVTGPHLHWEVWVNGVAVNPLQWIQQSFP